MGPSQGWVARSYSKLDFSSPWPAACWSLGQRGWGKKRVGAHECSVPSGSEWQLS
jgi:hypothetical protein